MAKEFQTILNSNSLLEVQMIRAVFETQGLRMQIVERENAYEIRVLEETFERAQAILHDRGIIGGEDLPEGVEEEEEPEVEFAAEPSDLPLPEGTYKATRVSLSPFAWVREALQRMRFKS